MLDWCSKVSCFRGRPFSPGRVEERVERVGREDSLGPTAELVAICGANAVLCGRGGRAEIEVDQAQEALGLAFQEAFLAGFFEPLVQEHPGLRDSLAELGFDELFEDGVGGVLVDDWRMAERHGDRVEAVGRLRGGPEPGYARERRIWRKSGCDVN